MMKVIRSKNKSYKIKIFHKFNKTLYMFTGIMTAIFYIQLKF